MFFLWAGGEGNTVEGKGGESRENKGVLARMWALQGVALKHFVMKQYRRDCTCE